MTRRVLILKTSPRNKGNSSVLADHVATGAKDVGADVECFELHTMDIRPCDACDTCLETGVCVLKDDMQILYPRLRQADAIVIASPVYWFTLSAQAKLCVDRWYALESREGNALAKKLFGIVLTYGDSDPYTSGAINAIRTYQDIFRYLKAEIVGIVYGSAMNIGDVEKQPTLLEKAYKLGQQLGSPD